MEDRRPACHDDEEVDPAASMADHGDRVVPAGSSLARASARKREKLALKKSKYLNTTRIPRFTVMERAHQRLARVRFGATVIRCATRKSTTVEIAIRSRKRASHAP